MSRYHPNGYAESYHTDNYPFVVWKNTARQFYYWDTERNQWVYLGVHTGKAPPYQGGPTPIDVDIYFPTSGSIHRDIARYIGTGSAARWVGELQWVGDGIKWYLYDVSQEGL